MSNVVFPGSGVALIKPVGGNRAANPTPLRLGLLQDVQQSESATIEEVFGQKQRAVVAGAFKRKTTLKGKLMALDMMLASQAYYGLTPSTGSWRYNDQEPATIPATSTYTITVVNAATFLPAVGNVPGGDFGVQYANGEAQLKRLPSGTPGQGQYTVNEATGVYTFAAADASTAVLISYLSTSSTVGQRLSVTNQLMGYAPQCSFLFFDVNADAQQYLQVYRKVIFSKFDIASKQDKYWEIDFECACFVDSTGVLSDLFLDV